jgi:hypothetical protein
VRRPIVAFLVAVAVPSIVVMGGSERAASSAQATLQHESATRIARLTLGTLDQDLGAGVEALMASADTLPDPDPGIAAVSAALAGDTVTALDPTESGVEVMVLFPAQDDPTVLFFNQGKIEPGAAALVGRMTGARVGLFVNGTLWNASDSAPALTSLDRNALMGTSVRSDGFPLEAGSLLAMDPRPGSPSAISAFAEPIPLAPPVRTPLRVVMALLVLLPAAMCWLLLARCGQGGLRRKRDRTAIALLAAVPTIASIVLAVQVRNDFDDTASELLARDLTRGLAVIETLGLTGSPASVAEMTGFHAVRVSNGGIEASTLDAPAPAVAALPEPPPSFTTSGSVDTPVGLSQYVSRKLGTGAFITVLAPPPAEARATLRSRTNWLIAGLVLWLTLAAGWLMRRPREETER